MRIASSEALQLTYCTNIHPGDGWDAVSANLRRYAPALKAQLSPAAPFGVGLRLSAREARELREGSRLAEFRTFLDDHGLYVAIINGFPHGAFHGTAVKANVYAPDWRDEARVVYTLDLFAIQHELLPEGMDGGVSTAPLSYKPWLDAAAEDDWTTITGNIVRVAEALVRCQRQDGRTIHLDIEPEPDCSLATSTETAAFFERRLLRIGGRTLADRLGVSLSDAQSLLLDHVRVCFDCCHFAVEFETPAAALARLTEAGIKVGRVQLSSALELSLPADPRGAAAAAERLRTFADSTYLHQVVERDRDALRHYPDLPEAIAQAAGGSDRQWRVHFHVPLFTARYDQLDSTQGYVRDVLHLLRRQPFTTHLEIETYTWDVLPAGLKIDLLESIAREYRWVLDTWSATSIEP